MGIWKVIYVTNSLLLDSVRFGLVSPSLLPILTHLESRNKINFVKQFAVLVGRRSPEAPESAMFLESWPPSPADQMDSLSKPQSLLRVVKFPPSPADQMISPACSLLRNS